MIFEHQEAEKLFVEKEEIDERCVKIAFEVNQKSK